MSFVVPGTPSDDEPLRDGERGVILMRPATRKLFMTFRRAVLLSSIAAVSLLAAPLRADDKPATEHVGPGTKPAPFRYFDPEEVRSAGSVTINGKAIAYDAAAGTLVVHGPGWNDTEWREAAATTGDKEKATDSDDKEMPPAEASMFYTAYFKRGAPSADRPITFLYNGGPGSATVWLHMGAFGPRKVVTTNGGYTPAAPYGIVNNPNSLLDASDLVFIDAPGTGYSRIAGKDKDKAFWGVDEDAHAFAQFIKAFLTKYDRWNSPKYLFGESYGTPRSAVLVDELARDDSIDFNGVMLLSQILNFDLSIDGPKLNPGTDLPYITALPSMAATAWYHNKLPGARPPELEPFLREVEHFAVTDYAAALAQGSGLDPQARQAIATKLAQYIGLPADYIARSDLRVEGGQFEQQLLNADGEVTGRLDSRFHGPAIDVLDKETQYDPMDPAMASAFVSAFHAYAAQDLKWNLGRAFYPGVNEIGEKWDLRHKPPGQSSKQYIATNVMPDLAEAMKQNPNLKVLLMGGYFDLGTPYFEGVYEMRHLPIPANLQQNISYQYFQSGHMVYANPDAAHGLHEAAAAFIARTSHPGG
jgi:carboxypeptidase C (cathepsin A)